MSTNDRIRGVTLQRIRARHLTAHPLCVHCEQRGRVRAAAELDHTVALCNGGTDTDDNRQGLCAECHAAKTRADRGFAPRPRIGLDGWPVEGEGRVESPGPMGLNRRRPVVGPL